MRIPLWLKLAYSIWLVIWIGYYIANLGEYDLTLLVWFCYVGLLVLGVALWLESPLLVSWQAVSLVIPQMVFNLDILSRLLRGEHLFSNWTEYIFDPQVDLTHRLLSWFHTPMPFLLLWAVWRLGYDRRALWVQIAACWVLLLLSYFLTDPDLNVNYVFGPGDRQDLVPAWEYLAFCMVVYPLVIYLPMHLVLAYTMPVRPGQPWSGFRGLFLPRTGPRQESGAARAVAKARSTPEDNARVQSLE